MRKFIFLRLMLSIVLLWSILPIIGATAPIYKWIDANGLIHYTQEPPNQVKAEIFTPKLTPGLSAEQVEDVINNLNKKSEDDKEKRNKEKAEQAKAQEKRAETEAKANRCTKAREQLETLHNSRRVTVKDDKGEFRHVDDDERAKFIKQMEKIIQENC